MVQQVRDLVLSLLCCRFDPWPRNFHMLWVQQKKKKKRESICIHAEKENDCNDYVTPHFCMLSTKLKEDITFGSGLLKIFDGSSL